MELPLDGGRHNTQYVACKKASGTKVHDKYDTGSATRLGKPKRKSPSKTTGCMWVYRRAVSVGRSEIG